MLLAYTFIVVRDRLFRANLATGETWEAIFGRWVKVAEPNPPTTEAAVVG